MKTLRAAVQEFKTNYVLEVLNEHNGNVSAAAKTLNVQRSNLYRMMANYGIKKRVKVHFHEIKDEDPPSPDREGRTDDARRDGSGSK